LDGAGELFEGGLDRCQQPLPEAARWDGRSLAAAEADAVLFVIDLLLEFPYPGCRAGAQIVIRDLLLTLLKTKKFCLQCVYIGGRALRDGRASLDSAGSKLHLIRKRPDLVPAAQIIELLLIYDACVFISSFDKVPVGAPHSFNTGGPCS
jgi:hypothetical protein